MVVVMVLVIPEALMQIDMTTVDSLTLTNPAFTILKLKVTPNP